MTARLVTGTLLLGHAFLAAWSLTGLAEFFLPTPWPRISNPLFPPTVLFLQWTFVLAAAALFLFGYALRWRRTPVAMACAYTAMAGLCAVETIGLLRHDGRWVAMGLEYAAYALILALLFRAPFFVLRFR